MNKKTIGILGCGWLGLPLAITLINDGYTVKGTVRKEEKIKDLEKNQIAPYLLEIKEDKIYGDLSGFLNNVETLVINIPPGLRRQPDSDFAKRMKLLVTFINTSSVHKLIFISSTSVFQDTEDFADYDESHTPNSNANNGKKIYAAEQMVQELFKNTTVIRPVGLIGDNRHPIKMLSGRTGVKNPDAPVNLVSREHLIMIIKNVIKDEIKKPIIHAVSETHEAKATYYKRIAEELNIDAPIFDYQEKSVGKRIISKIV